MSIRQRIAYWIREFSRLFAKPDMHYLVVKDSDGDEICSVSVEGWFGALHPRADSGYTLEFECEHPTDQPVSV